MHGNVSWHYHSSSNTWSDINAKYYDTANDYSTGWHTFTAVWGHDVDFWFDGVYVGDVSSQTGTTNQVLEFDNYINLTHGVGGRGNNNPGGNVSSPQSMKVTYVRVWEGVLS